MGNFDTLAFSGKHHCVLANNVASAHGGKTDLFVGARTTLAYPLIDTVLFYVRPMLSATTSPILIAVPEGASTL